MANKPNRESKAGKTKAERETYTRAIKTLGYETTLDESLAFPNSDIADRELPAPTSTARRPIGTGEAFQAHFEKSWMHWVVGIVGALLLFFVFNFNRDIGKIEGKIESFEKGLESNVNTIREIDKKMDEALHSQQREIDKVNLGIEKLDFKLQDKRKR